MSNQTTAIPEILTRGVADVMPSAETLAELMSTKKLQLYLGIDPTAPFLTLGHTIPLRKLQQFAEAGHHAILLIGNGTVRVGDPTGRDDSRPMLTDEQIEANFKDWKAQASKVLDFDKIEIRHNGDWLDKLTFVDIVQLMAKTTVQQLIERDMFQDRLKNGLPIHGHEIIYPLLQGYDSVAMDVDLEIGGNDQMFNMMMGRTLQKQYNNREKWALTVPLLIGTDGRKMSKSYNNYVALTDHPNDVYGKLMRVSDDLISHYFTLVTDVPLADIAQMERAMEAGENPITFKKQLAKTITAMLYDQTTATQAEQHFQTTIQNKELPSEMPLVQLPPSFSDGATVFEIAKVAMPDESNANLRRLITQGAIELHPSGERPTDINHTVDISTLEAIKIGKRNFFKIKSH